MQRGEHALVYTSEGDPEGGDRVRRSTCDVENPKPKRHDAAAATVVYDLAPSAIARDFKASRMAPPVPHECVDRGSVTASTACREQEGHERNEEQSERGADESR